MEEKIKELESRIQTLEKIEYRRKIKNIILLTLYGIIILSVLLSGIYLYYKIKPYKEKLDNLENLGNKLKIDDVVDGNSGFDYFDGIDGFDFFNNFFNY